MGEIIDLTKYIQKRDEKVIDDLSSRLASLIEDLGIKDDFEMYMSSIDEQHYNMPPYIYTMHSPPEIPTYNELSQVNSLSDITDVLTKLTLQLDSLGYNKWADQISEVVGDMFTSGTFVES